MANPGDTGNTATITLATSGFTGSYRRIGGTTVSRQDVNVSHLGDTDELYLPGDTRENGEFEFEFLWNPATTPPSVTAAAETCTVTFPKRLSGSSAAATWAGTGYIKSVTYPEFVNNQPNIGRATFKWDGDTPPAYTAEA
jgi:hypothetical protein